jgi:hypothetical protein
VKREQLEHVIRAAAEVAGDDEIVVIGSQAILLRRVEHLPLPAGRREHITKLLHALSAPS